MKKSCNAEKINPLFPVLIFAVPTAAVLILSALLVRNIGGILMSAGEEQFGEIFSQISDARIFVPFYIPVILWGIFAFLLYRGIFCGRTALGVISGIVLFAVSFLLSVWLTRVNGIRICDVAVSLFRYFRNGITDVM